jgi:CrcB protein
MTGIGSHVDGAAGSGPPTPAARHPGPARGLAIGLVAAGGAVGVALREAVSEAVPTLDGVPIAITIVNVVGAFLLGFLYERLARRSPGAGRSARLKLLIGTGFCGGLTTYSSLATDTAVLLDRSRVDLGLAYALGTVLLGALATLVGIALGGRGAPAAASGDAHQPGRTS